MDGWNTIVSFWDGLFSGVLAVSFRECKQYTLYTSGTEPIFRSVIFRTCLHLHVSGQITIIPKPELRGFWGDSLTKPPFGVTSAEVAIICPA